MAIRDVGGIEVLINLLDTDEPKCKVRTNRRRMVMINDDNSICDQATKRPVKKQ